MVCNSQAFKIQVGHLPSDLLFTFAQTGLLLFTDALIRLVFLVY